MKSGRAICYLVALLTLAVDVATKSWAVSTLVDGRPRQVVGTLLQFHYTRNPGAAFSMATGSTWILALVAMAVSIAIIVLAGRIGSKPWAIALGLVLGGSLGNLMDRVFRSPGGFRGLVVDWIELPHWPIFNIADSSIVCAAILVTILSVKGVGYRGGVRISNESEKF